MFQETVSEERDKPRGRVTRGSEESLRGSRSRTKWAVGKGQRGEVCQQVAGPQPLGRTWGRACWSKGLGYQTGNLIMRPGNRQGRNPGSRACQEPGALLSPSEGTVLKEQGGETCRVSCAQGREARKAGRRT